ncbi:MAG: alpha-2-macroglobulin family protein, partial [Hyphomicrobiales bacterium]
RRYYSTQDMAWMVLAARSVMNEAQRITLTADGAAQTGAFYRNFDAGDLAKPFTVSNPSDDALKAVVTVNGSPKTPEPAETNGMYINQTFFFPDGTPIEDMSKLPQNTRIVVVLEAGREGNDATGRFLLVDHLPAGLEIENPNLIGSGNTANLPWLSGLSYVTYSEFRDDRFVTAFNDDRVKVAYMARTVTPGTYVYPSATVEDMYRPDLFARTASTTLTVVER